VRAVDVQPELRAELVGWKLCADPKPDDLVFGTRTGKPDARHNVRRRVLLRAVERANANIPRTGGEPLPAGLSPHALRRSFASWLVAEGEDPAYVMAQLGHTDSKMTLELYARALTSKSRRADRALPGDGATNGDGGTVQLRGATAPCRAESRPRPVVGRATRSDPS